jgi:uncharacterized membrane protein YoaK (UPF0700 family)
MFPFLAQYEDGTGDAAGGCAACAGCGGGLLMMIIWLAVIVAVIAGFWKVFVKAGKPGWAAIIPIYNLIVLIEIAKRPLWWFVLFLIPVVNIFAAIVISLEIAKRFGKDMGFGIGLALLPMIFYPILGFGKAQYQDLPPSTGLMPD